MNYSKHLLTSDSSSSSRLIQLQTCQMCHNILINFKWERKTKDNPNERKKKKKKEHSFLRISQPDTPHLSHRTYLSLSVHVAKSFSKQTKTPWFLRVVAQLYKIFTLIVIIIFNWNRNYLLTNYLWFFLGLFFLVAFFFSHFVTIWKKTHLIYK